MIASGRAFAAAAALVVAFALPGCSGDDVELNGKIFDVMGVSSSSPKSGKEPKMVARAPLVVPPSLDRLPQPGTQPGAQPTELAAIADPDRAVAVNQGDLEKQQAAYCKEHYELAKQRGDPDADMAKGPLGPCRGSAFNIIKGLAKGDDEDQDGQVEQ